MSITYLKIKIKSLADEARTIRLEEKKWPGEDPKRLGLYFHRILDVRQEARSAQLAYGFLRKRAYKQLENKTRKPLDHKRIAELIRKYGAEFSGVEKELLQKQVKAWAEQEISSD